MLSSAVTTFLSSIILIIAIGVVIFIIMKLGKFLLKFLVGFVVNTVLGFITIILLDYLFNVGIPFDLGTIVATLIFGLPAVGTFVVLKLAGASLVVMAVNAL